MSNKFQGDERKMSVETVKEIERLESIRHLFKPDRFRLILAEALVHFFAKQVDSPTKIKNHTNKVLKACEVDPISLGFVRNMLNK